MNCIERMERYVCCVSTVDVRVTFSYRNMMHHGILPPIRRSYTLNHTHTHRFKSLLQRCFSFNTPIESNRLYIYVNLKLDMMSNIVKAFSIGLSLNIAIRTPATQYVYYVWNGNARNCFAACASECVCILWFASFFHGKENLLVIHSNWCTCNGAEAHSSNSATAFL